jgi:hypothetical protein
MQFENSSLLSKAGHWRDGEMEKWRDGEMEKTKSCLGREQYSITPTLQFPNFDKC